MTILKSFSVRQNVAAFALVFLALAGTTWIAAQVATDRLLERQATEVARSWANYLARSVDDLDRIASGEVPSAASSAFLRTIGDMGTVFRYEVFNPYGYSQLVADKGSISVVDLSSLNPQAARAAAERTTVVDVQEDEGEDAGDGRPAFFSRAYVPVEVGGRVAAVVAAYVDQTAERGFFHRTALGQAGALVLITGLFFGIPVVAWYRRTREKQQADLRIRYLAHHDVLTGLVNRASLVEALDREVARLAAGGEGFAVHLLDLDRFKEVNDTLGHDGGDALLKAVAERLRAVTRPLDVIARLGGDEFVVLQPSVERGDAAAEFAQRLMQALAPPVQFGEQEILTRASIGVAIAPGDGRDALRLLKSADLALYQSKADGRGCVRFFRPEMDEALAARIRLEKAIRRAIATGGFKLEYQPIFDIAGRRLTGFEALIRLPVEDGSVIPPAAFIPVAEELRLIDKVGAWVIGEACRTAAAWPKHLTVAVNLSAGQFAAGDIVDIVAAALADSRLDPHRLELEITESLLLSDSEAVMAQLGKLKEMGVAIVMDDFGTGYSSLAYLWRFPFDRIKIDQSFMTEREDNNADTVVKTIIALGHELHMSVTVEGIESALQIAKLEGGSGEQAQGFYLGRPLPAEDVAATILADFRRSQEALRERGTEVKTGTG